MIGRVSLAYLQSLKSTSGNMVYCFAFGCNHRSDNGTSKCSLFRFPTNPRTRNKWIGLCRYVDTFIICAI